MRTKVYIVLIRDTSHGMNDAISAVLRVRARGYSDARKQATRYIADIGPEYATSEVIAQTHITDI
jgi:hypothetical protein